MANTYGHFRRRAYSWPIKIASVLPESMLRFLHKHWKVFFDPTDGWTYWLDASYIKYVRNDKQKESK